MLSTILLAYAAAAGGPPIHFEYCPSGPNDCLSAAGSTAFSTLAYAWVDANSQSNGTTVSNPLEWKEFGPGGGSFVWQGLAVPGQWVARAKSSGASAIDITKLTTVSLAVKADENDLSIAGAILGSMESSAKHSGPVDPGNPIAATIAQAEGWISTTITGKVEFALACPPEHEGPVYAGGSLTLSIVGCFDGTVDYCWATVDGPGFSESIVFEPGQQVGAVPILAELECGLSYDITVTFHAELSTGAYATTWVAADSDSCAFSGGFSAVLTLLEE